jgi:hypothetical protein
VRYVCCYCILKSILLIFSLAEYTVAECRALLPVLRAKKVKYWGKLIKCILGVLYLLAGDVYTC